MKKTNLNLIIAIFLILSASSFLVYINVNFNGKDSNDKINIDPHLSIMVGNYEVPGISVAISIDEVLKVGILCDLNAPTGQHAWNGAYLAAKEINEAGGILINSTIYYVGLVAENTEEMDPMLDITKGILAANRMITNHDPHVVIGGTRTESVFAYQEVIMDAQIPFLGIGVAADELCENVLNVYARYKYFFRVMPINATSLANELFSYTLYLVDYLHSTYGAPTLNIGILYEDLSWSIPLANALESYLPILNPSINIVGNIGFPITITAVQMNNHLSTLDAANAQIVIPLISSPIGILMSQQYAAIQPGYLLAGLNVPSQVEEYWDQTSGSCRYEIMMQTILKTPITPLTIPFWNKYVMEYDKEPYFTGVGSYNAINLLANATIETQSFNPDTIVTQLEKINTSNPFQGVSGNLAFTPSHDLVEGWPFGTGLFAQWQMDGKKVVLPTGGSIYPDYLATGRVTIPHWGINNLVASYSHLLPGDFNLDSDADDPDPDGTFTLNWTDSDGADNYSLYMSNEIITHVSKKHTELAFQSAVSPVPLSGLLNGDYYFAVVAYNETGQKFSNYIHITVQNPPPGNFILSSDADNPDADGAFNLTWTDSEGADNYSVYIFSDYITEINFSLVNLALQTAISPFSIGGLTDRDYYFVVVAHNQTGDTLSNCIKVTVLLADDGIPPEISGFDWLVLYSVALLSSLILTKKIRKLIKK